jgi:hypothetical protein
MKAAPIAPPKQTVHWQKALMWLSIGFLTIIILTWLDAIFDFAHYISGSPLQTENARETAIKTVIILMLWILSAYKVYQIVSRLSYLENFVHLCAWCRRIEKDNEWLSLEEHLSRSGGQTVSHGICPECAKKVRSSRAS